uniref:ABC transporter n=1 Tax=Marseillevirus LCMAC103 TaxID=2506604 RepID=A0A481YV66_9VIRU|nr:MAG: ABC transporter [Marseillevirus LCMAC103]
MTTARDTMYDIRKTLRAFMRENRKAMGLYLALSLASPLAEVVLPTFYGKILSNLPKQNPTLALAPETKRAVVSVVVLWCVLQGLYQALDRLDAAMIPKLQAFVRRHIVLAVVETFKDNHEELELGDLLAKIIKLPLVIRDLAHQLRHFILPTSLVFLAVAGYLTYTHPLLGAVFAANAAALGGVIVTFGRACTASSVTMNEHDNVLHEEIEDILGNVLDVYAADSLEDELARLAARQARLDSQYKDTIKCASRFKLLYNMVGFTMFLSVNAASFYLYAKKRVTLAQVITTLMVSLFLVGSLNRLGGELRDFVFNAGMTRNMQLYLDRLRALRPSPPPVAATEPFEVVRGDLAFSDVTVRHGERRVLDRFSLAVPAGQKVAIVGKNGSGKTTLVRALLKLQPYEGTIEVDGQNIAALDPGRLRRQFVYVPQNPRLFNRTLYENITYGVPRTTRAQVRALLARFGLSAAFGGGLGQRVGKNGSKLSGGQRQIVFLLRCVLRCARAGGPRVVILDEPTASLDDANKAQLFEILRTLMQGRTVLMVTHDPFLLRGADRVVDLGAEN